jgi:hypothetical protein
MISALSTRSERDDKRKSAADNGFSSDGGLGTTGTIAWPSRSERGLIAGTDSDSWAICTPRVVDVGVIFSLLLSSSVELGDGLLGESGDDFTFSFALVGGVEKTDCWRLEFISVSFNNSPNDFDEPATALNPLDGPLKALKPEPCDDCAGGVFPTFDFADPKVDPPNAVPSDEDAPKVGVLATGRTVLIFAFGTAETEGAVFASIDGGLKNGEETGLTSLPKAPKPEAGLNDTTLDDPTWLKALELETGATVLVGEAGGLSLSFGRRGDRERSIVSGEEFVEPSTFVTAMDWLGFTGVAVEAV